MIRRKRHGFTLTELLVVMGIIAMLIALLLPAVQAAVEAARKARCQAQQRDIALGIMNYVSDKERFPGWRSFIVLNDNTTIVEIGWVPQLYQYLDDPAAFEQLLSAQSDSLGNPKHLKLRDNIICPSDPPDLDDPVWSSADVADGGCGADAPDDATKILYPLSYAVTSGKPDVNNLDTVADAVFHDHGFINDGMGNNTIAAVYVGLEDLRDGLSATMIVTENIDLTQYTMVTEASQSVVYDPSFNPVEDPQGVGFPTTVPDPWPLNRLDTLITPVDCDSDGKVDNLTLGHARPVSYHHEGFMAAYADGRTRFFHVDSAATPADKFAIYRLYRAALTPANSANE